MMQAVSEALTSILGMLGTVVNALTNPEGDLAALLPLLAVGVAISVVMLGAKVIRSFIWGA